MSPIAHWRPGGARGIPRWLACAAGAAWVVAAPAARAQNVLLPEVKTTEIPSALDTRGTVDRMLPMEVTVNGAKQGNWLLLERLGKLYASSDAFEEWRLQVRPDQAAVVYKGVTYLPLAAIPGFSAKINFAEQSIDLTFSPQAFASLRLTGDPGDRPKPSPVLPSVFANYDLSFTTVSGRAAQGGTDFGLQTEVGISGNWGVLTNSMAGRHLAGSLPAPDRGWIRLETTYTRDLPGRNMTLRLGDTSTRGGMWGRTVFFGGLQFGTNYALTPGFITQATPVLAGTSSAPSTVELYVNEVLRQVSSVPSGPFVIDNRNVLTGNGEARLVVRDVLGRETVISQPFFSSGSLLAPGLDDWSVEAGGQRLDLGTGSGHYADPFASALWRRGIHDELTAEGRIEVTRSTRTAGVGLAVGLPAQVLGRAALALSSGDGAQGRMGLLGLERQTLRTSTFLQVRAATIDFRQLGHVGLPSRREAAGNFTFSPSSFWGSFGVGFASIEPYDAAKVTTVSGSYSRRIGARSTLTFSASRALTGGNGTSVGVSLVIPLDSDRVVTSAMNRYGRQTDAYASVTQNPGSDEGLGWRVLAGQRQSAAYAESNLYYAGGGGQLSADLSASRDVSTLRLGAAGGLVMAEGRVYATRTVTDSFALVELRGYPDIGVGLGSNVLSRTDAQGFALVPRLVAYQNNAVRVDPRELPISAELDSIEIMTVPSWRSGVKVVFPVRSGRGALVRVVLEDGDPAPAGAMLRIEGDKEEFYVARRGEAFVTGLQNTNKVRLEWKGRRCELQVDLPPPRDEEIPRVGPLVCKGVAR